MLEKMDSQDAEYWKLTSWLDNLLAIPFGQYKTPFLAAGTEGTEGTVGTEADIWPASN